jgi:hypothetical protein
MTISQHSGLLDYANTKELILDIYMLTHCIIGASCFYSRHIVDEMGIYMQMIRRLEEMIHTYYDRVNLDAKCEFLVCARMLGYESHIYTRIMDEASASLSPMGNFIIDTHNDHAIKNHNIDPLSSEHRNVLYIMANTVPHFIDK